MLAWMVINEAQGGPIKPSPFVVRVQMIQLNHLVIRLEAKSAYFFLAAFFAAFLGAAFFVAAFLAAFFLAMVPSPERKK
jgi:hypothetical protein